MAKQRILRDALVLTICGIICKALGAIYRVPLTNILGAKGMGIYYLVFPVYSFMLALSSSSLPSCLSKLVADSISDNKPHIAKLYFNCSLRLFGLIGIVSTVVIIILSPLISSVQGNFEGLWSYFVIAPAVLFVCIISCYRGYFQGYQNMAYSGVSQIVEQVVKVVLGLVLTSVLLPYGVQYGVLGSVIAITISEMVATLYLFVAYLSFRKKQGYITSKIVYTKAQTKDCYKTLIKTVVPFALGYIIFPLVGFLDSLFVIKLLTFSGVEKEIATSVFGLQNAVVGTLTNLPIVVSTSLAMVVLPSVSYLIKRQEKQLANERVLLIFKMAILVILPCVVMFIIFSKEIIFVLFGGLNSSVFNEMMVAQNMLKISSIGILFLTIFQLSTAILQGQGKEYRPVKSLAKGALVKVFLSAILLLLPGVNFYAINIANLICYITIAMDNMTCLQEDFDLKVSYYSYLFAPVFAAIIMVFVSVGAMWLCAKILPLGVAYFVGLLMGGGGYILSLLMLKTFTKNELKQIFKT